MSDTPVVDNPYAGGEAALSFITWLLAFSFAIAFIFTLSDRISRSGVRWFVSDLMVRWAIAQLLIFFITWGLWAAVEYGVQKYFWPFPMPLAPLEHLTIHSVAVAAIFTLTFFGASLFIQALLRAPITVRQIRRSPYWAWAHEYYASYWETIEREGEYQKTYYPIVEEKN